MLSRHRRSSAEVVLVQVISTVQSGAEVLQQWFCRGSGFSRGDAAEVLQQSRCRGAEEQWCRGGAEVQQRFSRGDSWFLCR